MEVKLKMLFDYQRYEPSSRLAKLIAQTESRGQRRLLSDEETELVSAAGTSGTLYQEQINKRR